MAAHSLDLSSLQTCIRELLDVSRLDAVVGIPTGCAGLLERESEQLIIAI